jgi:hypothetical protein
MRVRADAELAEARARVAAVEAAQAQIRALSEWIDNGPSYVGLDSEAHTWRRLGKVGEEFGEVIEAWLGVIGENQRKGKFGSMDDVNTELLDVATCALAAVEHNTGNEGRSVAMLAEHVASRFERAGLLAAASPPTDPKPRCTCPHGDTVNGPGTGTVVGYTPGCPVHRRPGEGCPNPECGETCVESFKGTHCESCGWTAASPVPPPTGTDRI